MSLSGFPANGFRAETLDGTPPWNLAFVLNGESHSAKAFAESIETLTEAPSLGNGSDEEHWIAGIIGDTQLRGSDARTNDVDFYRIELPEGNQYAIHLEVVAQRFGSALDGAVTLLDSSGQVIAHNDDARQDVSDSELYAGLNGGTYFIAVTAGGNTIGPGGLDPFTPGTGHGSRGSTGQYLLHVSAVRDETRPVVTETSITPGAALVELPTQIAVRFSEAMDLEGLRHGATLTGSGGDTILLRAIGYDSLAREVTYLLLDRPVPGSYQFTLHASWVTDRADNPLDGGAANGNFTLDFQVAVPACTWLDAEANETVETAQQIGPLYINELNNGVSINGVVSAAVPGGDHDFYRVQVTRAGLFTFRLRPGQGASQTGLLKLHDASGVQIAQAFRLPNMGSTLIRWLVPGEYLVHMDGPGATAGNYQLTIQATQSEEGFLVDNNPATPVQVVLRTRDGEKPLESADSKPTQSDSTTIVDPMSYAVSSLAPVATQPIGKPKPLSAGSQLAWVDQSGGRQALPAGFVLGDTTSNPVPRFSVNGVSGTFHDSLPDAIPHGIHPLDPSTHLVAELAALVRGGKELIGDAEAAFERDRQLESDLAHERSGLETDGWVEEAVQVAISPPTVALGVIATLGASSAVTVTNRRRIPDWVQFAIEWLGLR